MDCIEKKEDLILGNGEWKFIYRKFQGCSTMEIPSLNFAYLRIDPIH